MATTEFGTWLRSKLDGRGLRQSQLANYAELDASSISRWLAGTGRPDPESCRKLAEFFHEPLAKVYALAGWPAEYTPPERQPLSLRDATVEYLSRQPIEVPVLDQLVSAGSGAPVVDYVYFSPSRATSRNLVAYRVRGQSMEPEVSDGDTVIVDPEIEPRPGHIVVATIDGEGFCKRFERTAGHNVLRGNNGAIPADDAQIEGVVIQTIHDVPH